MKSGYSKTIDKILKSYGMRTDGIIGGTIGGEPVRKSLVKLGYRVEKGIDRTNYDFIYISRSKSTPENVKKALTKIDNGCILIVRVDVTDAKICPCDVAEMHEEVGYKEYRLEPNQFLIVLVKRYKSEG